MQRLFWCQEVGNNVNGHPVHWCSNIFATHGLDPQFQEVFAHAGFSTIKTLVMMLGEIDFGGMLAQNVTKNGIVPTSLLPYPEFTIVYFVVFVALISILLMNLLVGVAINNVNSVEDSAVLQRLSMQVSGILIYVGQNKRDEYITVTWLSKKE